jgi:hypothetical protein
MNCDRVHTPVAPSLMPTTANESGFQPTSPSLELARLATRNGELPAQSGHQSERHGSRIQASGLVEAPELVS